MEQQSSEVQRAIAERARAFLDRLSPAEDWRARLGGSAAVDARTRGRGGA